jgi:hypothetical protein
LSTTFFPSGDFIVVSYSSFLSYGHRAAARRRVRADLRKGK